MNCAFVVVVVVVCALSQRNDHATRDALSNIVDVDSSSIAARNALRRSVVAIEPTSSSQIGNNFAILFKVREGGESENY